ncbi:class I SAM-dependent methyltransferase [Rubrivirga sp.]|uniref:class I SAM-dependent methyltransferase n=1 Tax=Rubrivirga sp. TaxID=1885344 RepID=UPI003C780917
MKTPQTLPDRLLSSWTVNAEPWTQAVRNGLIPSRAAGTDAAIVEAVVRGLPPNGRVLDVGCGEGWLSRALVALGARTHGVDASVPLIEAACDAGGSFEVVSYDDIAGDPTALGGPYDVAVFNFALLSDKVFGVLRGATDQLAPCGRVIIQTVHPLSIGAPYTDGWREETFEFADVDLEPMPWYARTFGTWVRTLDAVGLQLREVTEPTHPDTGAALSLILTAEPLTF